jgi:rare lipoprotein A
MTRRLPFVLVVAMALSLAVSCGGKRPPKERERATAAGQETTRAPEPAREVTEPTKKQKKKSEKGKKGYAETGVASWYGKKFHGRQTANGERYDMYGMTAAHKTLPFGTMVEVTNLTNGKKVTVRINDRGPFIRGRIIDLTYTAAKKIDMIGPGTAKVRIRVVKKA